MNGTLFGRLPDGASDYYRALFERRSEICSRARDLCDEHWQRFQQLADREFPARFPFEFQQRWFEMYLGVSLLDMGLDVSAPKPGPDLRVQRNGLTVWFEAVVPHGGAPMHPDAVPEPPVPPRGAQPIARRIPTHEIALRIAQAIRRKIERFDGYRAEGRVDAADACVIAISVRSIPDAWLDLTDHLHRTLYGIGDHYVTFHRDAREDSPADWGRHAIEELVRSGGAAEDAIPMVRLENASISAVLGSTVDACNLLARLGDDFVLCPHVEPNVPLPAGLLPRGVAFACQPEGDDGYTLRPVDHANTEPARLILE